uniref:DEFENSIN domain-containing protein n=1 Tax=Heterorhabditis bacteriophora TaxID=37862 RepID=A0A1I7XS79_HETBA
MGRDKGRRKGCSQENKYHRSR